MNMTGIVYRPPYEANSLLLQVTLGCKLYSDMKNGTFKECTIGQLLDEQERLISRLELKDTIYFGSHPSNFVPMQALLPKNKDEMLRIVRETRKNLQGSLDEYPTRGGEGSIINR